MVDTEPHAVYGRVDMSDLTAMSDLIDMSEGDFCKSRALLA